MPNVYATGTAVGTSKVIGIGMSVTVVVPVSSSSKLESATLPRDVNIAWKQQLKGIVLTIMLKTAVSLPTPGFADLIKQYASPIFHFIHSLKSESFETITSEDGAIIENSDDLEKLIVIDESN
jgi:hypothetical protein